MIKTITSNRVEFLTEELCSLIKKDPLPVFTKDTIVIPSGGMERYLSFAFADRFNICADIDFIFPSDFLNRVFTGVVDSYSKEDIHDSNLLVWDLLAYIRSSSEEEAFHKVKEFLLDDSSLVKHYQFAEKMSDLLDQYTIYRPDMLLQWEDESKDITDYDELWQSSLWKDIIKKSKGMSRVAVREQLRNELSQEKVNTLFNGRVFFFGVTFLPKFYLDILEGIGTFTNVYMFLLNPSRHFWDDIISQKTAVKIAHQKETLKDLLHYDIGNELLATLGVQGREFFKILHDLNTEEESVFFDNDDGSLLGKIQNDILNLSERESVEPISVSDNSIEVHICHSPLREVEVLKNNILDIFEKNPKIVPNDIVVMTPDIDEYAPYIETVFEENSGSVPKIPYSIADTSSVEERQAFNALSILFTLKDNRFAATDILTLLEFEFVQKKFRIEEKNVVKVKQWVNDTNIRWGLTGEDKRGLGLPPYENNTWKEGMMKMFTGTIMENDEELLIDNILPFANVSSSDRELYLRFFTFVNSMVSMAERVSKSYSLTQWCDILQETIDDCFIHDDTDYRSFENLVEIITQLKSIGGNSHFEEVISPTLIKTVIDKNTVIKRFGRGYISEGVTFCNMLPMRSIPFKVVAIVGLNEGTFPRSDNSVNFDLIGKEYHTGDRMKRFEDRYCFLESLLSARYKFYLSYVGKNIYDNSEKQPSLLITELLDYIDSYFCTDEGESFSNSVVVEHRLNGFSYDYFAETKRGLFSYSYSDFCAAQCKPLHSEEPFIPLKGITFDSEINYEKLLSFFGSPVQYFLKESIGVRVEEIGSGGTDIEPFSPDNLESYHLKNDIINVYLSSSPADALSIVKAKGLLPHGYLGDTFFENLSFIMERLLTVLGDLGLTDRDKMNGYFDLNVYTDGVHILGRVPCYSENIVYTYKVSSISAKDKLLLWIKLALIYSSSTGTEEISGIIIGIQKKKPQIFQYSFTEESSHYVNTLIELFKRGQNKPLDFFPKSSYAYAKSYIKDHDEGKAAEKAYGEWEGSSYSFSERDNDYYRYYPHDRDIITVEFKELALQLFAPIIENETEIKQ